MVKRIHRDNEILHSGVDINGGNVMLQITEELRDKLLQHLKNGTFSFVAPVIQALEKLETVEEKNKKTRKKRDKKNG